MFCELFFNSQICASGSGVEYNLAKVGVAGSNPVSRSIERRSEISVSGLLFSQEALRVLCKRQLDLKIDLP